MKKALLIFLLVLVEFSASAQCAMCRAVLQSGEDQSMAEGINDGIVYLMAIPYILVGGVFYFVYKKMKQSKTAD
jgi:hypothetical protein